MIRGALHWFSFAVPALAAAFGLAAGPMSAAGEAGKKGEEFVLGAGAGRLSLASHFRANPGSGEIAAELASILEKITGRELTIETGASEGIVLGVAADFPELAREAALDPQNPFGREDYAIRSSKERLLLLGATEAGMRLAVADLLHRWGYRQFFPGKAWEVVPRNAAPSLTAREVQRPAFHFRDIFTASFLPGEEEDYKRWCWLNRLGRGFQLNTRHAYQAIYKRHRAAFAKNRDFFAYVDGEPQDAATKKKFKFNAANPALLQLLVEDARALLTAPGAEDSVSMDPSDFGGWDNSGEAFKTIGNASNQAVTMTNIVAREAAAPLGKYVGMYAYYDHQFPPGITLEPNVIVSFATRFLKPGRDLYESIGQWREKGARQIGIRDYHSVWEWDLAMPGRALGGNLHYLGQSIPRYYGLGARFYTSESQSAWGAYGLGFYVTTRLLWNPAEDVDAIVADFLEQCFGPAAEPMGRFYRLLNGDDSVLARSTAPSQFYASLLQAWEAAEGDPKAGRRILELIAYVRYVELLGNFERANEEQKAEALREVYAWVLQIAPMQMLPTKAMIFRQRGGLGTVYKKYPKPAGPELAAMREKAAATPVTDDELLELARAAVAKTADAAVRPVMQGADEPVSSPWMRNGSCFVFPLKEGERAEAALSMRRFGFSELPRYVVLDPEGRAAARGQMRGERDAVTIEATAAGLYSIVLECTPNLVKCESARRFYLGPTRDFGAVDVVDFRGSLFFSLPEGVGCQIAAGGQGDHEKIHLSLLSAKGDVLVPGGDFSGTTPLVKTWAAAPEERSFQVRFRKPGEGAFEDAFFKFNGGYSCPLGLSPNAYPTHETPKPLTQPPLP